MHMRKYNTSIHKLAESSNLVTIFVLQKLQVISTHVMLCIFLANYISLSRERIELLQRSFSLFHQQCHCPRLSSSAARLVPHSSRRHCRGHCHAIICSPRCALSTSSFLPGQSSRLAGPSPWLQDMSDIVVTARRTRSCRPRCPRPCCGGFLLLSPLHVVKAALVSSCILI